MPPPLTIAVTGGSGLLGRHLIEVLASRPEVSIRAISHRHPLTPAARLSVVQGDVLDRDSVRRLVVPGCVVINLAWDAAVPLDAWRRGMGQLAGVCAEAGAARLIHCSTAVVVGQAAHARVDETTPCSPRTPYERAKLGVEAALLEAAPPMPLVIARPTAVFGRHGRNLVSLSSSLLRGPRSLNYLRSCLFDRRRMHLTSVENVVAALQFLASQPMAASVERYLVSDDDEPENNFRDVERWLMKALDIGDYSLRRFTLPPAALAVLLRLAGRADVWPRRVYDGARLKAAGFTPPQRFAQAVDSFGRWYRRTVNKGEEREG